MSVMEWRLGSMASCVVIAACSYPALPEHGADGSAEITFYQRTIEPILLQKCAGNTSGCHSTNASDPFQFAAGNLDVTSFDRLQKRRDLLTRAGAYPYPPLLIKSVAAGALKFLYDRGNGAQIPLDIEVMHSGGPILSPDSEAFTTLQHWLDHGATGDGVAPATPAIAGTAPCSHDIPAGFAKSTYVTPATQGLFGAFVQNVQPILARRGCAAGNCHGAPPADFYLTCGETDDERAVNFSRAWGFIGTPVEDSVLLRAPLATVAGGRGHAGGDQFTGAGDPDVAAIRSWAEQLPRLDFAGSDPGKQFFASYVQPVLIARGCTLAACHSPEATNSFQLSGGAPGFGSPIALERNYRMLRDQFMAIEFPDARRSRAVAKGLIRSGPTASGIAHRAGAVLEQPGQPADPAICPPFNPLAPGASSPYCILQHWLDIERTNPSSQVTTMSDGSPITLVYVQRPIGSIDRDPLDFDTFRGGSELRFVTTTFSFKQHLAPVAASSSIAFNSCQLTTGADVRHPDIAPDGDRVVFAARPTAAAPFQIFLTSLSEPTSCVVVTPPEPDGNGLKVHNFDPVFSPDGNWIVFASTRGKPGVGPTRSRKRLLPQADLWRLQITGTTVDPLSLQQVTFLSNSEVRPAFTRDGRITMTTEKASAGFYQLSGRRINWDLTDYHALLGQRASSPYADPADASQIRPSIGYASATDIRENTDGSFLVILSDLKADGSPVSASGGGALGIFDRSIGPFEQGRDDPGYLPALRIVDGAAASGRLGAVAAYRNPAPLPSGEILISYASSAASGNYELVVLDPRTGDRSQLITGSSPSTARVDAVLAYKRPPRPLYRNRRQLVFGGSVGSDPSHAVAHLPDAPLLFTLLTGNLRRGRPVDAFRGAKFLAVYAEGLCPASGCTTGPGGIFESRQLLGTIPLERDGSARIQLPSRTGVVLELQDANHHGIVTMGEEHQLGPGEQIAMGVAAPLFDAICAGCHGSISGRELDVHVTPDALTGASASASAALTPASIGP